jgi:quinoprotein dehydrogenase-associated probable ABC transporter substrate-binding protein
VQTSYAEEGLPDPEYLKVCADPYMLPFSNRKEEGYENKIAQLLAKKLGLKLKYEFFPQRIGFIRNTLRAESEEGIGYKCDLVISAPSNFELAATTDPYFTSTYVLVYAKGRKLDSITEPAMLSKFVNEGGNEIKIGLPDRGPQQLWVFYNELMGSMVRYQGQSGDPKVNPGQQMVEDVAAGKIDATIIWGPTAGYFAKQFEDDAELVLLPLKDDPEKPEMRFTYSFSMAVRYGEKAWKDKINNLIKENKAEIDKILIEYGVPLIK